MKMKIMPVLNTAVLTRGTFGFVRFSDEDPRHPAIVEHVFSDGRLGVHYSGNTGFYAVITPDIFSPSKDAYFCEGSYVEPMWEGNSCRCTNYWSKHSYMTRDGEIVFEGGKPVPIDANRATNIMTDEEALKGV